MSLTGSCLTLLDSTIVRVLLSAQSSELSTDSSDFDYLLDSPNAISRPEGHFLGACHRLMASDSWPLDAAGGWNRC